MEPKVLRCLMAAAVTVLTTAASAQSSEPACTVGVNYFVSSGVTSSRTPIPFTATVRKSFEQHLPDGGTIRGSAVMHQARDSSGRTMQEMINGCRLDDNGVAQPDMSVSVYDPATRATLSWQLGPRSGHIAHLFRPPGLRPPPIRDNATPPVRTLKPPPQPRPEFKREDLGDRTIAGVEAHGWRITRTIAPGQEGNDVPLLIVNEDWRSKDLNMTLLLINDDPRRGRNTVEVKELSLTEPDPSVFAPPEGYTIVESKPNSDVEAPEADPKP